MIEYALREEAERAIKETDGTTFLEKEIHTCVLGVPPYGLHSGADASKKGFRFRKAPDRRTEERGALAQKRTGQRGVANSPMSIDGSMGRKDNNVNTGPSRFKIARSRTACRAATESSLAITFPILRWDHKLAGVSTLSENVSSAGLSGSQRQDYEGEYLYSGDMVVDYRVLGSWWCLTPSSSNALVLLGDSASLVVLRLLNGLNLLGACF